MVKMFRFVGKDNERSETAFDEKEKENPVVEGKFLVENLRVDADDKEPVKYDKIALFLNNQEYDGRYENWYGQKASADDLFEAVLNNCLRGDIGEEEIPAPEWRQTFQALENQYVKLDESKITVIQYPQIHYGELELWTVDLETEKHKYVRFNDEVKLLNSKNSIICDIEPMVTGKLYEDAGAILCGELDYIYQSEDLKEMMEEQKDELIEEYLLNKEEPER